MPGMFRCSRGRTQSLFATNEECLWFYNEKMRNSQLEICNKYGADFYPSPSDLKVGIALNVREKYIQLMAYAISQRVILLDGIFGLVKN